MNIAITKLSSKGQVVIPAELREDMQEGEKLLIIKNKNQLILKKASEFNTQFKDDLEFARRTEEALTRTEKGEFTKMDFVDSIAELKQW